MKIPFPVDGFFCSEEEVHFLVNLMNWYAQPPEITIITLDRRGRSAWRIRVTWSNDAVNNYFKEQRKNSLERAAKNILQKHILPKAISAASDVAAQITAYAKNWRADMKIIGPLSSSAIPRIMIGSVATMVLAMRRIPNLIVR